MNAMSDLLGDAAGHPDLDVLLAPLAPDDPCGPFLRHDPVFTEIRLLREEDNPTLPMGQWVRPLKVADWPRIERLCTDVLATRSKDLQLASWLAESWMRRRGFAGLLDGLRLVEALLQRYWDSLHPRIDDDGDSDARLAPLEWLNESLGASVRLHAVLFTVDADKPTAVTVAAWERLATQEAGGAEAARNGPADATAPLTRADILAEAARLRPAPDQTGAVVRACLDALRAIAAVLHERLHDAAPNLAKLQAALDAALRVLAQFEGGSPPPGALPAAHSPATGTEAGAAEALHVEAERAEAPAAPGAVTTAHWRSRRDAYATLEALADYLGEVEPHSPTPFLIRRAASWGRMSLPEVIAEIISQEGDVSRLFQILGMKS